MRERIRVVLDELRPFFEADGGDIELIHVSEEGIVQIRLTGSCGDCTGPMLSLKQGLEKVLKEQVPEVKRVIVV